MVNYYAPPLHGKIIEPFAGSARYSLKYFEKDILLVDKYDVMIKIWKWLQQCSEKDILKLPRVKHTETLNDFTFDCEEAKLLLGFIIKINDASPCLTPSPRLANRPNRVNFQLQSIAKNLFKIKHWNIVLGDYADIENQEATWFIDPPYQFGGEYYVENKIDFPALSSWCQSRKGQVIVCENSKANWMPFNPLKEQRGCQKSTMEVWWTNQPTSSVNKQLSIFA